jgi:hypothetical protein
MLYRLVGLTPGLCGRRVGRGGIPSLRLCCEASPDVEVAAVVDGEDDATTDEFRVDVDLCRDMPLLYPFAWPFGGAGPWVSVLTLALLFLRRLLRKEGMAGLLWLDGVCATMDSWEET